MARAIIRANAHLPGMPRGSTAEVELTDREVKRAASGQISILRTWDLDEGQDPLAARIASGTIPDALALVDSGEVEVQDAIDAEIAGKHRAGLVDALTKRAAEGQDGARAVAEGSAGVEGSPEGPEAAEGN